MICHVLVVSTTSCNWWYLPLYLAAIVRMGGPSHNIRPPSLVLEYYHHNINTVLMENKCKCSFLSIYHPDRGKYPTQTDVRHVDWFDWEKNPRCVPIKPPRNTAKVYSHELSYQWAHCFARWADNRFVHVSFSRNPQKNCNKPIVSDIQSHENNVCDRFVSREQAVMKFVWERRNRRKRYSHDFEYQKL